MGAGGASCPLSISAVAEELLLAQVAEELLQDAIVVAPMRRTAGMSAVRPWRLALLLAAVLPLCACGGTVTKHGTQFRENDIQQIQPGMSQEQVRLNLGTPATTAVVGGGQ